MSTPEVGRQRNDTAAANDLVPLVLGLTRVLERVAAAAAATGPAGSPASAHDDEVLAALLGVLSVRRTLRRWLDAAGLEAAADDPGAPAPAALQGSWLR